jgi:hypothetical protein
MECCPDARAARVKRMIYARNYLRSELYMADEEVKRGFDKEYINILDQISAFIKKYCDHKYVDDYVDLDCDGGGMYIKYCEICEEPAGGGGPGPA